MDDATFVNETVNASEPGPRRTFGGPIEGAEGTARRIALAGLGAVATARDTANDTFERFVDRGERAQEDLRQRADEARSYNAATRGRVGDAMRGAMNALLDAINVPNKADVDTINVKLNILTRKLDDLQYRAVKETQETQGSAAPAPSDTTIPPRPPEESSST